MKNLRNNLLSKVLFAHVIGWSFVIVTWLQGIQSVEIRRLSVPRWIQNGTEDSVVLDCDYVYNENDLRLVVKWFFNDNNEPVYQWIPELNRRYTSGVLSNRLDLDFAVNTADAYSRFRALRIKKPSTELSGKYTCLVTSLAGQDARDQVMTVYVPENEFELSYKELEDSSVNVTCEAQGLFPPPVLKLYLGSSVANSPKNLIETISNVNTLLSGVYDAYIYRTFSANELSSDGAAIFECSLELPGTNYLRSKRIAYYSGVHGLQIGAAHSVSSSTEWTSSSMTTIVAFFLTMICEFELCVTTNHNGRPLVCHVIAKQTRKIPQGQKGTS